ncbi:MAG: protein-tyrosine phosphatase [Bacteroidia bacterium]|jgi:protein-tyrosine phosphatase
MKQKVLFVCLGNICRSPLAEGLFNHMVEEMDLEEQLYAESAGTAGYHIGSRPDVRTLDVASQNGVEIESRAQKLTKEHFAEFDVLVAMDERNYNDILEIMPKHSSCKVFKMRQFDAQHPNTDVPDPYYGDLSDFEDLFQILVGCMPKFIASLNSKD